MPCCEGTRFRLNNVEDFMKTEYLAMLPSASLVPQEDLFAGPERNSSPPYLTLREPNLNYLPRRPI
jgi:hypothetical protein